jgi:hypothetical protein
MSNRPSGTGSAPGTRGRTGKQGMRTNERNRIREDVPAFVREEYRKRKAVPSIRKILRHYRISTKRFYRTFPEGLREVCQLADVPPPEDRLAAALPRDENLVEHEGEHALSAPASSAPKDEDPEVVSLQRDVKEREQSFDKKRKMSTLLDRKAQLEVDEHDIDREISRKKDDEFARRMPFNQTDYSNGMRVHLRNDPPLQDQLRTLFWRTRRENDFERWVDSILRDTFKSINNLPAVGARIGYPLRPDADFPKQIWEWIIENLRKEVSPF